MEKCVSALTLMLLTITLTHGYCPREKMSSVGFCSYKIHCIGTIRNIKLNEECQMYNDQVNVDLELVEAIERINDKYDELEFLKAVTSFKASASWPETSLALLEYMPRLKNLNLTGNNMKNISGSPFFYLKHLENLDLSHNNISDVYDMFIFENEPSSLKILNLSHNCIEDLEGGEFEAVSALVELDLSHNLLSELTDESFTNLTNLEILRLNNNRLNYINGSLNDLLNLKQLYLGGNSIQYIGQDSVAVIRHLQVFDISQNGLIDLIPDVLDRNWFGFVLNYGSTFKIILSGNYIPFLRNATLEYRYVSRFIRNTYVGNHNLSTELDLANNEITNIEFNAFQTIVNLTKLDLSSNKLIDFIINSTDLAGVQYLNLSDNYLLGIYYETFRSMIKLTNLDLSYNRLEYIPDETFRNNVNLKYVNMSFNDFNKIDKLTIVLFSAEGGVLDLSNNAISKLNIPFGEALRLTILKLESNQITNLTDLNLYYQIDLRILVLKRNGITHLNEDIVRLPYRLISLDLSFNKVSDIGTSTFKYLGNLEKLRLGHNSLMSLPYGAFQGLGALKFLDLSFNKIGVLDSKAFMDLKQLRMLSLRYNQMYLMSNSYWFDHDNEIRVYLDGNHFTCEWVGNALKNYKSGLSKMLPSVLVASHSENALNGIPCEVPKQVLANYEKVSPKTVVVDERLLITNQKILDTLRQQTEFMRKLYWYVN